MFKLLLILLLYFEPTWSYMKIVLENKNTVYYSTSLNDSNLEKVSYFEGDLIYASCLLHAKEFGGTNLRFIKRDKLIYESKVTYHTFYSIDSEYNVIMQIKMLPEFNNSVLECTNGMNKLSVILLLDESIPDYALKVNGIWFFKLPNHLKEHIYYKNSNNEDVSISVPAKDKINEDVKKQENSTRKRLANDDITVEILSIRPHKNSYEHILMTKKTHVNSRVSRIVIDCGTLCFDPFFVNLDPSKVLAKYIPNTAKNNISVVKYELDFDENAFIRCTSVSGKGNISVAEGKATIIHNETTAVLNVDASGRFRCVSSEDGRVSTTILDVTRKNKNIMTIKEQDGRIKDKTKNKSIDKISRLKGRSNTLDQNTYGLSEILIAIFVTMITTSAITTIIYTVCLKRRRRSNKPTLGESNPTPADSEPVYETVGYGKANEPGDVHRPQREPYPLPPEESEENKKYVHYDTPYEWRIFRSPFRRA